MSQLVWSLRLVAVVGPVVVLFCQALALPPLQPRQDVGFVVLAISCMAVALTLFFLLRPALATHLRHRDLLVPLGLYLTIDHLANYLLALPALAIVTAPWGTLKVSALAFTVSLAVVMQIALGVFYGGWVTRLILQAVEDGRIDLLNPLARPWGWFGRVFVAETIGWCILFAMVIPAVFIASGAMPLGLLLIGVGSLLWNLATAALLPVVVSSRTSLGTALAEGFRASWNEKRRWWNVVVAQMVLLGWVTFLSATVTTSKAPGNFATTEKTNWSVNAFWTGGYEDETRWYGKVADVYETQKLQPVSTLLGIAFAILAIAIKARIVRDLRPPITLGIEPLPVGGNGMVGGGGEEVADTIETMRAVEGCFQPAHKESCSGFE
jgi:hypothetical protein